MAHRPPSLTRASALRHLYARARLATGPEVERATAAMGEIAPNDQDRRALVACLADCAPALLPHALADAELAERVLVGGLHRPLTGERRHEREIDRLRRLEEETALRHELRRMCRASLVRIALREALGIADVDGTGRDMATLAAQVVDVALGFARRSAEARHGRVVDEEGKTVPLVVLGMGKLGGNELNLGSDIDICFFYGTDEATLDGSGSLAAGRDPLDAHTLFARVAAHASRIVGDVDDDGFCFRVDLRLRPEGSQGALVNSLASAERYYEAWGRTWERAALLRARPIAGDLAFGHLLLQALEPFIYRRSVDPRIAHEMAELLARTRREQTSTARSDIKIGIGGIREAEFFVQSLQLIWGGKHPTLRTPGTMPALLRLSSAGLVTDRERRTLADAWAVLRRVEHAIHMHAGYQTHTLPEDRRALDRLARTLGAPSGDEVRAMVARATRDVHKLFASLGATGVETEAEAELARICDLVAAGAEAASLGEALGPLGVRDLDEAAAHLLRLGRRAAWPLGALTRQQRPDLGPALLADVRDAAVPDLALRNLADFFARLSGPWPYERLLYEDQRLRRKLIGLFGSSATLSALFIGHPEEIDGLLMSGGPPSRAAIDAMHASLDAEEDTDEEAFVGALRRMKRTTTLRVGLAYVGGELDLSMSTELLSALAEAQTRSAFARAARDLRRERGVAPRMVVFAMGKLGGSELGFGGDLDLLFLHAPPSDDSPEAFALSEGASRLAQRTLSLLSRPDAEGPGYSTDARLRPSGSQGTLVSSLEAFERYQAARAAPWERQALVRARAILGAPDLVARAEAIISHAAYQLPPPTAEALAQMRARMEVELAREGLGSYHPKVGHGGLVDIEFAVQWLQMRHGNDPLLRAPSTPHAIAALLSREHLSPSDARVLSDGYGVLRGIEQAMRLLDEAGDVRVRSRSSTMEQVARALGIRARGAESPATLLESHYVETATAVRSVFERLVAPVGTPAPWEST